MQVDYVIVQAGGKGERMMPHTANKPKALVSIDGLPILFHLFRLFPDKHFIIIGDYKEDVLSRYLEIFADVDYTLVSGAGHFGNCAGLIKALAIVPPGQSFMLIWSDLILPRTYTVPEDDGNYVGISRSFRCRWSYEDGSFEEKESDEHGVAGLFIFQDTGVLDGVWEYGEFASYLSGSSISFEEQPLFGCCEYGLAGNLPKRSPYRCRPFNRIEEQNGRLVKTGIDDKGRSLAEKERAWYQKVGEAGYAHLPSIHQYEPLVMEKIDGKHPHELANYSRERRLAVLQNIVSALKELHAIDAIPSNQRAYEEAYLGKTLDRLSAVKSLIPFAGNPTIRINGRSCRNIFFHTDEVRKRLRTYLPASFPIIHGDCTFSNTLIADGDKPVFIDPRGYFGHLDFYGDAAYDWAKLYYSLESNYDKFNVGKFSLRIEATEVALEIESSGWESMEKSYLDMIKEEASASQLRLYTAILWLSLSSYAWDDYDSICGAFYNGSLYLESALSEE